MAYIICHMLYAALMGGGEVGRYALGREGGKGDGML